MMRNICYVTALLVAECSAPPVAMEDSGQQLAVVAERVPEQATTLGETYAAYSSDTVSAEKQRAYFMAFPGDYASLRKVFGFEEIGEDSTKYGEYYEQGNEMIGAFFRLPAIPAAEFAKKAVGIARNGVWQEDGVGYYQMFLARNLEKTPAVYLDAVVALPVKERAGFWSFYVDGPEPYPMEDAMRLRRVLVKVPEQISLVDSILAVSRTKH